MRPLDFARDRPTRALAVSLLAVAAVAAGSAPDPALRLRQAFKGMASVEKVTFVAGAAGGAGPRVAVTVNHHDRGDPAFQGQVLERLARALDEDVLRSLTVEVRSGQGELLRTFSGKPPEAATARTLRAHAGPVVALAFSPASDSLASCSRQTATASDAVVWDVATGTAARKASVPEARTVALPGGGELRVAGGERRLVGVDLASEATTKLGELDAIPAAISPAGDALGFADGRSVWVTDVATGARRLVVAAGPVRSLAVSDGGAALAAVLATGEVSVWERVARRRVARVRLPDGSPDSVALSADGRLLAVGDRGRVTLWEVASGDLVATLRGGRGALGPVAVSTDGRFVAAADGADVVLWRRP